MSIIGCRALGISLFFAEKDGYPLCYAVGLSFLKILSVLIANSSLGCQLQENEYHLSFHPEHHLSSILLQFLTNHVGYTPKGRKDPNTS